MNDVGSNVDYTAMSKRDGQYSRWQRSWQFRRKRQHIPLIGSNVDGSMLAYSQHSVAATGNVFAIESRILVAHGPSNPGVPPELAVLVECVEGTS